MKKLLSRKRGNEIIGRFPRARVLVVGDVMVDHFIWGRVSRISPEAPVPVVEVDKENLLLGGSANVANNICGLGGQVFITGVIGADAMGDRILSEFRHRGIDTKGVVRERERPTTMKTRIVAQGQQVVRFDRESRRPVSRASTGKVLRYVGSLCGKVGAVVISDYNKGMIGAGLLDGVRKILAGSAAVVCVDPKQNDFSLYRGFDVITPNHHEAQRAVGDAMAAAADLVRIGNEIIDRHGFRALLITRGEDGMSLFEKDGRIVHTPFPTLAKEVFDVTGAGDTVIGTFALCMASGASFREAAVLANAAAGIVVGKRGTATVTPEELRKAL
ncbi:MAG: Bifunctional protein HldE [Syntrophaceae bacterium PtaU1.Bin231]|nr:MAG: Bifunctional protein HldE [Syntrophaceae bacterium PtaU1.Bin231]HOG17255.1 D-glycero-beta-D-manno-heptose-7-phosphate kinase [Syntrophales bacterium]